MNDSSSNVSNDMNKNDLIGNINSIPVSPIPEESISPIPVSPIPEGNIDLMPVSPMSDGNNNGILNGENNINFNNTFSLQSELKVDDEELLKVFVGKNYEKISSKIFNVPGFFFTSFYMFYRKMFIYALLVFLLNLFVLNVLNSFLVMIGINIIIGFFVNKIYLFYAKNKINKLKSSNSEKSIDELKSICSSKGGTSVGKMFLGLITEFVVTFIILLVMLLAGIGGIISEFINIDNFNFNIKNLIGNTSSLSNNSILVEDVSVVGYSCFSFNCNISVEDKLGKSMNYIYDNHDDDLLRCLDNYSDYIKLNIFYIEENGNNKIVDYKIYLKSNNEDIGLIKNENELREKIGLYSIGTHTDTFVLSNIGITGFGMTGDTSYTYTNYIFTDSNNVEYEMRYLDSGVPLNLEEGNSYTVTFEVEKSTFDYDFTIKSIK